MIFTVDRTELTNALTLASKVAASRTPQHAIQGVRIEILEGKIVLQATDLDLSVTAVIHPSFVDGEEDFIVIPDRILQSLREVNDKEVTFSSSVSDLILECSAGRFKFRRMGAEDFPQLPKFDLEKAQSIKAGLLNPLFDRTSFCAGREKGRYAINGVYATSSEGLLTMVATDGKRLSLCSSEIEGLGDFTDVIFPVALIDLVHREISRLKPEEEIFFSTDSSQAFFKFGDLTLSGRLVEGEYPNYSVVIPKQLDKVATIDREEFLRICRISSIFTDPLKPIVVFNFSPASLSLESSLQEQGESRIGLDIQYDGENVMMGLNPVYLIDYLKILTVEEIKFHFTSGQRAVLIDHEGDEFKGKYVLMPMRIRD